MMRLFGKIVRINLPDLGEGTKEATIKEWFVKEGQIIKEVGNNKVCIIWVQYDDICEVFTDKLVAKIPSTHDGVVKSVNYKSDEICLVGKALVELEIEDGASTPEPPKQAQKKVEESSSSSSEETGAVGRTKLSEAVEKSNDKVLATPAVRSIAKRNGIDLK